jgi:RNA polymerase sigma-70 factor, ECF subfamily
MREAIHNHGGMIQKPILLRSSVLARRGIPPEAKEGEVYWFEQKNVELTPFDSEYVELLKARDPRTQEHFGRYFCRLLTIKLRGQGIYGSQMDDIRQETLIRSLKSIYEGKVDSPERLIFFVRGVCDNVIREFIRGEINSRVRDTNEFPELPDLRYAADDSVRHHEVRKSVTLVMEKLPEKDRAILTAVFLAEHDKDVICREHGISRDYLRVLLHRSLINARKILDKQANS